MKTSAPPSKLAAVLAVTAIVFAVAAGALLLGGRGSEGTQMYLTGCALFVAGLLLSVASVIAGFVKQPRNLVLPFVALVLNLAPVAVFVFLLSVLTGMKG